MNTWNVYTLQRALKDQMTKSLQPIAIQLKHILISTGQVSANGFIPFLKQLCLAVAI